MVGGADRLPTWDRFVERPLCNPRNLLLTKAIGPAPCQHSNDQGDRREVLLRSGKAGGINAQATFHACLDGCSTALAESTPQTRAPMRLHIRHSQCTLVFAESQ